VKDYRAIEGLQDNIRIEVKAAYDKGYKQGFQDGIESKDHQELRLKLEKAHEYYRQGLDDAWKCLRKIFDRLEDGMQAEVFGTKYYPDILEKYSASEAMAKIREYEKQKCNACIHNINPDYTKCKECVNHGYCDYEDKKSSEIKVGDEITIKNIYEV